MKKLKVALLVLPLASMAGMAQAAVDLTPLDSVKTDLGLAGAGLLGVVLVVFAARKVAGMFGR